MNYSIIIEPLVGAVIGYITNWIAIKMMFRPLKPIKLFGFKLPFTPGIIPKNKERIAKSIGIAISDNLLTNSDLQDILLSDEIKEKLKENIKKYLDDSEEKNITIKELLSSIISESELNITLESIATSISSNICNTVLEADLARLITDQIELVAKEKMKKSFLGMLGGNSLISSYTSEIYEGLDTYIKENSYDAIHNMVDKEIKKYEKMNIKNIVTNLDKSNIDSTEILINIYEKAITNKLNSILENINISQMITNKINNMEVLELEKLILSIMKKELNALVNLGAIIGFILGLTNLLF